MNPRSDPNQKATRSDPFFNRTHFFSELQKKPRSDLNRTHFFSPFSSFLNLRNRIRPAISHVSAIRIRVGFSRIVSPTESESDPTRIRAFFGSDPHFSKNLAIDPGGGGSAQKFGKPPGGGFLGVPYQNNVLGPRHQPGALHTENRRIGGESDHGAS